MATQTVDASHIADAMCELFGRWATPTDKFATRHHNVGVRQKPDQDPKNPMLEVRFITEDDFDMTLGVEVVRMLREDYQEYVLGLVDDVVTNLMTMRAERQRVTRLVLMPTATGVH